jgi:hypothetical protein
VPLNRVSSGADTSYVEPCHACGASVRSEAEWCGQCFAPRARAAATQGTIMTRPLTVAPTLRPTVVRSRWRKTPTTYGPVGRLIATATLVIPFFVLLAIGILDGGMTIGGAALWGILVVPWGLRDTWRAGTVSVG